MMKDALKLKNYELLSQKAYRVLKEAIVRGDIKSNTRLTLNEIAQYMGISKTPIREAINHLASEGFIKLIPNKGIIINEIINNMEISVKKDDRLDYNELDIKFHDFLLNIAANNKLKEFYNRLILQDHKFRFRTLKLDYRMQKSLEEHKKIALKIKERDSIAASRSSQEHIKSIILSLKEDEKRMRKQNI